MGERKKGEESGGKEGRKEGRKGRESSLSVGCPWGIGEMSDGFIQPHVAISSGLASE